jgi:hypothetical protein
MPRRPPSTYLTADELKLIAAIRFIENEPDVPSQHGKHTQEPRQASVRYPVSKELRPPK